MVVGSSYPLANAIWTMFVFFGFVIWMWMLFMIFADIFSRHDAGGWAKAGWCALIIILPILGSLIYLIANGKGMAERRAQGMQAAQADFDQHIRNVAGGPAGEIKQAKELLDSGAITAAEYERIKQGILAGDGSGTPVAG